MRVGVAIAALVLLGACSASHPSAQRTTTTTRAATTVKCIPPHLPAPPTSVVPHVLKPPYRIVGHTVPRCCPQPTISAGGLNQESIKDSGSNNGSIYGCSNTGPRAALVPSTYMCVNGHRLPDPVSIADEMRVAHEPIAHDC